MKTIIAGIIVGLLIVQPLSLDAGCNQFFVRRAVAVHQVVPAVVGHQAVQPQYRVAGYLQREALQANSEKVTQERERRAVELYRQGLSDAFKLQSQAGLQPLQGVGEPSVIQEKCGQCHGPASQSPKASLYFGQGVQYDGDTVARALAVLSGVEETPKGMEGVIEGLKPEDLPKIMEELLRNRK